MNWACALLLAVLAFMPATAPAAEPLRTNRQWEVLPEPGQAEGRRTLAAAADFFADLDVQLAGEAITRARLGKLAETPSSEPLTRRLREALGQAVDRRDFLFFLDDLARAQPDLVRVHSGRARRAGILLHPGGVFADKPRHYGRGKLAIAPPPQPPNLEPAPDGAPLGPRWSARYPNPADEAARMAAIADAGHDDFRQRLQALFRQLREQGARVYVQSTLRRRERGYLMYGAFILSRARDAATVSQRVSTLQRLNRQWGLDIPIRWQHPDGWRTTTQRAQAMAEAYNVVYATRRGARYSSHYTGKAIDVAALPLPRSLRLQAPDGASRTFDLSAADEPRDLNLTPRLIDWIEKHFGVTKLRRDYPHWQDAGGG